MQVTIIKCRSIRVENRCGEDVDWSQMNTSIAILYFMEEGSFKISIKHLTVKKGIEDFEHI